MLLDRLQPAGLVLALIFSMNGCADATPVGDLAARAVSEAKSMPSGRERDVTLREISRNLRHADRDRAIEAAAAMSEDYELRTFAPRPDKLTRQLVAQNDEHDGKDRACDRFIEGLKPGRAKPADDRRIRDCFLMDAPPGIVAPPVPPFRLILLAADALPAGPTEAQLLYMATWDRVPDRPAGGKRDAVRRLRALIPLLDGDIRQEATGWLDTTSVDLIEGRSDDAIARVRRRFASNTTPATSLAGEPVTQARGLIYDFMMARDLDRAVTVTNILPPTDCAMVGDGLTGVLEWLPELDSTVLAAYLARLQTTGTIARLCPKGLGDENAAAVWLKAGNDAKALDAATASEKPLVLARTQSEIIERRLSAGDMEGARSMARTAAANPASLTAGSVFERAGAAGVRVRLIYQLARLSEVREAERLAAAYPGPGWRGFAYSVIVATKGRDRAVPNWGGPFLDLTDVPADR